MSSIKDLNSLSEEDRKKEIGRILHEKRDQGFELLRQSGTPLDFNASINRFKVIFDNIELEHEDGKTKILVDGMDISSHVVHVNVSIAPLNFPSITIIMAPKPIRINTEP